MIVGWKVLGNDRMSCLASVNRVHYKVNEAVTPQEGCGPLCVFSTEGFARRFVKKILWRWDYLDEGAFSVIVKCEYQPSREHYIWHSKLRELGIPFLPTGTVLADSVTCLE